MNTDQIPPSASDHPSSHSPRIDQPLSWSVPAARIGGVTIRIHAFLLVTIVIVLIRAAWHTGSDSFPLGPRPAGWFLAALILVVTIHELVTVLVSRRLGGHMPEVVLQPLGGLDDGVLPPGWRRAVITALVGPLSAITISVTVAVVILISTGGAVAPNPFSPVSGLYSVEVASSPWLEPIYILGAVATVVAGVNLLPAPPFRGRILFEAVLRPQMGTTAARRMTRRLGVLTVTVLLIVGLLGLWLLPVLVGAMCAASLHRGRRQAAVETAVFRGESWPDDASYPPSNPDPDPMLDLRTDALVDQEEAAAEDDRKNREALKSGRADREAAAREETELDRVLEKIATDGLDSLDRRERRLLARATERRREDP